MPWLKAKALYREQRGFTLPEVLTVIAILGILVAIAVIIWLGLLERWRVNAAAEQLAADLRLAHSSATNELNDWRVVLVPERKGEEDGPDYYLIKLNGIYEDGSPKPTVSPDSEPVPRTFPANVKVMTQNYSSGSPIRDNKDGTYYLSPPGVSSSEPTRTLEFNSDGAMTGYGSPSGTVRVTIDGDPLREVRYISATSRVKVLP